MSYNLSKKNVERWKSLLDRLLPGQPVGFKTDNPHMLAYWLREAIESAKEFGVEPYSGLNFMFSQDRKRGLVIAKPKTAPEIEIMDLTGMEQDRAVERFPDAANAFDVIALVSRLKLKRMEFPNFTGDTQSVRNWCDKQGYTITHEDPLILEEGYET